jgi:MFS family permease
MDKLGVSGPTAVAKLVIVVGISSLIAVFPAGHLSDKVGRKPVVVSAGFLGASSIVWLLLSRNYTQVLIGGGLIGIANGSFIAGSWALATDLVAKGDEARGMGLVNLASAGGSALARLAGPVIDLFNRYQRNLGYSVMLLLSLGCYLAGSILLLVERTTPSKMN